MSTPIKTFWIEPSGRVEITTHFKDGREEKRRYSKEEGDHEWAVKRSADSAIEHRGMSPLYTLPDGTEATSRAVPAGALFHASWLEDFAEFRGADGIALVVRLPNGHDWLVDSKASNCTRKDDKVHKCWCRHGDPRTGSLHVDKAGDTCAAGAGSIQSGDYHGFLQHGYLVQC